MALNMTVDATDCPVERPSDYNLQRQYYSGKSKKHCIKYEVGIQIQTGKLVWLAGGTPGSVHDLTISRASGLSSHLLHGEFVLADKAYIGEDCFLTPFKPVTNEQELEFNSAISSLRETVEHTIGRIKVFGFTQQKWRHSLDLHPIAFKVICNALNIEFETKPVQN
jgi:hypothetical protein